jgi:leucyl/phenylalanyl-tRNA--protein transferase
MPVFQLTDELIFPPPEFAEDNGLLAVGGDLSKARLLLAYSMGIFPWYSEGSPILWWSPDPRLVLLPHELKVSRSLGQEMKKGTYTVTMDTAFEKVIKSCATVKRKQGNGTWITSEMIDAYTHLHHLGYAHSVESWFEEELAGGLYGVALGGVFFGESMFTKRTNASKVALVMLVRQLMKWRFMLIDCQITTRHLMSLGAREIPRREFMAMLRHALTMPTKKGSWAESSIIKTQKQLTGKG